MDPIEMLMVEHRLIEKVLDALEPYAGEIERRKDPAAGDLGRFTEFIQTFADRCHHGKEEDILFVEMVKAGFPERMGPLAVMRSEHDEGRRLVRILAGIAAKKAAWTDADRRTIVTASASFAELLRQHIQKEDNILYPMAQANLGPEKMAEIGERFERFERETIGEGEHERLHALAEELIERYPATGAKRPVAAAGGGCIHGTCGHSRA